jgi:predicted RNA-binding protein with PUA-like domain
MHWLFKSEPETYSFQTLQKQKKTNWDQVRNFQARNFLKEVKKGDLALIYHSGDERAIVGIAKVVREAYPDPDTDRDDWVQIDLAFEQVLARPIPLKELKADTVLKDMMLVKQSRLSCMPVTASQWNRVLKLSEQKV